MTRRSVAILIGALTVGTAAAMVALWSLSDAPGSAPPSGSLAAERGSSSPSDQGDWRAVLAKAVASGDDGAFRDAVQQGLAHDPAATLDAVKRLTGFAEHSKWALSLWLERDLKSAWNWAARLADGEGSALLVDAFDMFAARDPAAALHTTGALRRGEDRVLLASRALRIWAHDDPAAAWLAAQDTALPGDRKGRGALGLLDLRFNKEGWKRRRGRLSTAVLDVWAERGWREPLAAVAATKGAHVPDDWQEAAIAHWAEAWPSAAWEWASSLPDVGDADRVEGVVSRKQALGTALATMAIHWPHKATAAAEEIGDWQSRERQGIYNSGGYRDAIARFAATEEPRRLVAWFESHPDEQMRWRHADDMARSYAAAHPQEALEWARRLPTGFFQRANAVWAAVTTIADGDNARAAAMLVDMGDAELVKSLAPHLVADWAKEDPLATLGWVETHAPKEWDTRRRMTMFNVWAREDAVAAAAHLPELADAEKRVWATHHVINGIFLVVHDEEALRPHLPRIERLYATLPPEARSQQVAYFLYRHYQRTDPERAARYQADAGDDHGDPWDFSGFHSSRK